MKRTELINYLIQQRDSKRYLEIGVHHEQLNFAHIRCVHKVGVDPRPVTTFQGISDDFFAHNCEEFDLIFIDGLHTEEQTLRDIANAYRCLAAGGIILLHDCMPPDSWYQREPELFREGEPWNGTVWKAALREFNQTHYKCTLLDTDWGCGIIDTAQSQTPLSRSLPAELQYEQHYTWLLGYRTSVAAYLREQVKVIYHLACMGNWRQVFEEQLRQLRQNGFQQLDLTVLGTEEDLQTMRAICREAEVEVCVVFQASELTYFETLAMLAIEKYSSQNEGYVLYLHGKGVSNPNDETKTKWRRLMMRELVENWEQCVLQFPHYDVIGVNWCDMPPISHFSGNFWYASTRFLRKLADFKHYYENPRLRMRNPASDKRLGCEFWIGSGYETPRILSLAYRNVKFWDAPEFWQDK